MDWQLAIVAILVGAASLYLAVRARRTWLPRGDCSGGCCGKAANSQESNHFIPRESLQLRSREQ